MPHEFTEYPYEPDTQTSASRGFKLPGNMIARDLLDPPEAIPPSGLMKKRRPVVFWIAIALLLGPIAAVLVISLIGD
jgi:hypothetical protein